MPGPQPSGDSSSSSCVAVSAKSARRNASLGADAIVTFNAGDFPRHVLAEEGIERRDPDGFLWELWSHKPEVVAGVAERVRAEAERLSGEPQPMRALLKRAKLPRLGKALEGTPG